MGIVGGAVWDGIPRCRESCLVLGACFRMTDMRGCPRGVCCRRFSTWPYKNRGRYPREGQRELRRGVDGAEQNVREAVADLVSAVEGLHQRVRLVRPGHRHRRARLVHDDGVRVGSEDF